MQSIREQRRDQMFPKLDPVEIERVRRFGEVRSFAAGESLGIIGLPASSSSSPERSLLPSVIISTITNRSSPMVRAIS
jgi:hypothetical protein